VYYALKFFEALGQSNDISLILSGIVNICQLVSGIPILMYLDRVGRRNLAIIVGIFVWIPRLVMAGLVSR
jgi:hypothetical protein